MNILKVFFALVCFAFIISPISIMAAEESSNAEISKILEEINKAAIDSKIQEQWIDYLKTHSSFTDQEYRLAIMDLGIEFSHSVINLENCVADKREKEKYYPSNWLNDLINEFGEDYIAKNIYTVKFVAMTLGMINGANMCTSFEKDALYKEMRFREVLSQYTRNLAKFSETLDKESREKLKPNIEGAKAILNGPEGPLKMLVVDAGVKDYLQSIALKNRKGLDSKITDYLLKYPAFSKPFDVTRIYKDLKRFEKSDN